MTRKQSIAPGAIVDVERTPPHNLEAERSVLGAILIDNTAYERVADRLKSTHFYRDAHRRIYEALAHILDEMKAEADLVTLTNELARRDILDVVGGPAYVASLVDGLPHATNVKTYGNIVREKAILRAIIQASSRTMSDAFDGAKPSVEILKATDTALLDLQLDADRRGFAELSNQAHELFSDLEDRVAHKGELRGIQTGFRSINDQTMGWQRGDLIVLAARPSIGKTALALNHALHAAQAGAKVAIFSLEMRRRQLEYRMLAALSGVQATHLLTGYMSNTDYEAVVPAFELFAKLPIYINDRVAQTAPDIRMACRRLKGEVGLDLVIIDYVQLMQGTIERRGATRNEEITDISRRLKVLADELNVPLMLLSQLKRTGGARPTLEDLRESGSLEQDCDLGLLLHRKNHKESGVTNFMLEKQRNGPTGTVNLSFDRDTQRFTDAGDETPEQAAQAETEDAQHRKTRAIIRQRSRGK